MLTLLPNLVVRVALSAVVFFSHFGAPADARAQDTPVIVERAFRVSHGAKTLAPDEKAILTRAGITQLYWEVAELETVKGAWRFSRWPVIPQKSDLELNVVPVVKVRTREREPLNPEYINMLIDRLIEVSKKSGSEEVQLDWFPPERLLAAYADALKTVRQKLPRLTITAKSEWVRHPAFPELKDAVAELHVFSFDPDELMPADQELVNLVRYEKLVEEWEAAKVRWRIVLPSVAKITAYDLNSRPKANLRLWVWEDLLASELLDLVPGSTSTLARLRINSRGTLARVPLEQDEMLVVRIASRDSLAQIERTASVPVVYYRYPDQSDEVIWSVTQISALQNPDAARVNLELRAGSGLALVNSSDHDLPVDLAATKKAGGYQLQVEADGAVFRDAKRGDFARILSEGDLTPPGADKAKRDPAKGSAALLPTGVLQASRLTFVFPEIRAGETLRASSFHLQPGVNWSALRYRFLNVPGEGEWKSIKPVP